eukprot:c22219_g1_i1 orf=958-1419(+)
MASSVATPSNSGPSDWKKLKIQELREALTSTEIGNAGLRFPSSERLVNSSKLVGSSGNSAAVQTQSQDKMSRQESKTPDTAVDRSEEASRQVRATPKSKYVSDSSKETEETLASGHKLVNQEPSESNRNVTKTSGPLTDLERKQRRAQRFGVE